MFHAERPVSIFPYVNYRVLHISWPKTCTYIFYLKLINSSSCRNIWHQISIHETKKNFYCTQTHIEISRFNMSYKKIYLLISNMKTTTTTTTKHYSILHFKIFFFRVLCLNIEIPAEYSGKSTSKVSYKK